MKKIILLVSFMGLSFLGNSQVDTPNVDTKNKRLIFSSEKHLKDFMKFHTSDDSEDQLINVVSSLESKGFESLLNEAKKLEYYKQNLIDIPDGNIEEDPLIGDDRLARLLNYNREIVVGGNVYKYESNGLYFTNDINGDMKQKVSAKKNLAKSYSNLPSKTINNSKVYDLGDNVSFFSFDYQNSINNKTSVVPENFDAKSINTDIYAPPYTLENCNFDDSGFFESLLPGSSETCNNYIDSDRRIKTKFSNQNYLLFSSVYAKVKSQKKKKFLGITTWKRDNFCKYLEMGRTVVIKYPIEYPSPPVFTHNFLIKDNGYNRVIDINGNTVYSGIEEVSNVFETFPFDASSFNYEIYFYVSTYNPKPKDINRLISEGLKGLLKSLGKSFDDLFGKDANTNVGMTIDTPDGIYFTEYGEKRRKYGISRISKTYDVNFKLKLSTNGDNFFGDLIKVKPKDVLNAKTYEVTVVDIYGFGSYGGSIYGSRIVKGDLNDENSNGIDSDGDGVPDHEDFCRFQKGVKKYGGCPYSLIDRQSLYASRVNKHVDVIPSKSSSNIQTFGACYELELKSADYPSIVNEVQGGIYPKYDIVAGKEILIKGEANVHIKPAGNTKSITLRVQKDPCDIITPVKVQKSLNTSVSSSNFSSKKDSDSEKSDSFLFYPNPISDVLNLVHKKGVLSWVIRNNQGQEVLVSNNDKEASIKINTSTLGLGIYFLNVTISDGKVINKIIVKE
ncbi:putative secreted protein (Por secretion system target) [Aquimarina sp. MAR_2010_214]|uniref:T9SS type A sorting domain-containing protein n=1 Tax=Aquimarina sp. MAR_2010_214 TaxID=1250026 RepID=UPI000C70FB09|nr:T9SS type A sorting domain-containing protein [Aquimarina sp. MAR_2010_214]PKV52307.1 putative secreted protein (Por secretion system target) [Aquimarina sp. MAR_2010_214]